MSAFPLSYARSRRYPIATLPDAVQAFYVVTMTLANALLAQFFPSTGPGSDFSVVPFDVEYVGRKHSDRAMRPLQVPLPRDESHFLRLLTIARDGVVLVFDLLALGSIPARVVEILANPFIIKVGIELKSDSILLLRHYAVPVYNGWELSQLWKCMHPSIDVAPLTSHISLDDMARILLRVRLNKDMQTSDWSATILSEAQLRYAILDAYIILPMVNLVRMEYESRAWSLFTAASFSFNADLVSNGAIMVPGPNTRGVHIRVWGVGMPIPVNDAGDWSPSHPVLDSYNGSPYSDCRSTSVRRFFARELNLFGVALRRLTWFASFFVALCMV
ncbi:ribonuclease H-like domain-containing protein [Schizophyllum commune]